MTTARRLGAPDARSRTLLLDAAERVLLQDGYAAVTSRRVAAAAGLKPQLVHYYFRTMDDLFLEVFRRRADEQLRRFDEAVGADRSLRTVWEFTRDPRGAAFTVEFAALSNHRKAIRAEVAAWAERFRAAQLAAIRSILDAHGVDPVRWPPMIVLMALTGTAQLLALDASLGIAAGHDETVAFVDDAVVRLDPADP